MGIGALAYGVWGTLVVGYCALLAYIATAARRAHNRDQALSEDLDLPTASLLIPFHNEARHIPTTVAHLKRLKVPIEWEVLFIDDHSTDRSAELIRNTARGLPYRILQSPKPGKKHALHYGVRHARCDLIIAIDADVRMEEDWLIKVLICHAKQRWLFGTGPVFIGATGSWLKDFQYMEYLGLALLTAAGISTGRWALANGANMAWKRSLVEVLKPWEDNMDIPTGDDVFFALAVQRHTPKGIGYWRHAPVYTSAEESLTGLVAQRRRWSSKLPLISTRDFTTALVLIGGIHWCTIWLPVLFTVIGKFHALAVTVFITTKMAADYAFLRYGARFYNQRWPGTAVFIRAWLVNAIFHGTMSPLLYWLSHMRPYHRMRVTSP